MTRNIAYTSHAENIKKFNEDVDRFEKEDVDYDILYKAWQRKWDSFLNSLSNEELKAYSELKEAFKTDNKAKLILARRNFISLLIKSKTQD